VKVDKPSRYLDLLGHLDRYDVEFIVVGGVAAIIAGCPITTLDLDIVYERSPRNLERLNTALQALNAYCRDPAGRHIVPTVEKLATFRTSLLITDLGPLDLLTSISGGGTFEDLLDSSWMSVVGDLQVRVLELEKVIESKKAADREKDRAVLPVLRRTLELSEKDSSDKG